MADATTKTVRKFEITDEKKRRFKTFAIAVGRIISSILPVWLYRYLDFKSPKSYGWNNYLWRKREFANFCLFIGGIPTCWVIIYLWLSALTQNAWPNFVVQFLLTLLFSDFILNKFSRRWLQPDFSDMFPIVKSVPGEGGEQKTILVIPPRNKRRLGLLDAPDANGPSFPIGWTPRLGWVYAGYHLAGMQPETYPSHLVVCGKDGHGQEWFALNAILRFREITKGNGVILILDSDGGGLDFRHLKDLRGVFVFDTQAECDKAIWFTAQVIRERRKYIDLSSPGVLLIGDMWNGATLIGRNPGVDHLERAVEIIVEEGNNFGVNVIAFPPPKFYYAIIPDDLRLHYDRVQFFTKATYKIKQGLGDMVERRVESPEDFTDLFLYDVSGMTCKCRQVVPKLEQVMYRMKMIGVTSEAMALWNKFAMFDFDGLGKMPAQEEESQLSKRQLELMRRYAKKIGMTPRSAKIHVGPPTQEFAPQPNDSTVNGSEVND